MIKTDAEGNAHLTFQSQRQNQDLQYTIEARVTDLSRREVISRGTVQVTRQPYYVYLNNEHNLYRPQDKVRVNIKALDANSQPVQTEGTVHVTRDIWYEIWIDPKGKEVQGKALEAPAPGPGHLSPTAGTTRRSRLETQVQGIPAR